MKKSVAIVWLLLVLSMAAGTLVQRNLGVDAAQQAVYHSWWFALLFALLALLMLFTTVRRLWHRASVFGLHLAFLLMLLGALLSTLTGQSGEVALTEESFRQEDISLPFTVAMEDFQVVNYPGTDSPQDYRCQLIFYDSGQTLRQTLSMNHIGRYRGYRFYLSGYDTEGGLTLKVCHDPYGIAVTYISYILLLISMTGFFFDPHSRFRQVLRQQRRSALGKGAALVMLLFLMAPQGHAASEPSRHVLPPATAAEMGRMMVLYNGRICPLQTFAHDFVTKLYGAPTYQGLTAEQVLSGWIYDFAYWREQPIVRIKGASVRQFLGTEGRYASFAQFSDGQGQYRLETLLDTLPLDHPLRSKYLAADEKYHLVTMLYSGQLFRLFPLADSTGRLDWYAPTDRLPLGLANDEYLFLHAWIGYSQELVVTSSYADLDTLFTKTLRYQQRKLGAVAPSRSVIACERLHNRLLPGKPLAMAVVFLGIMLFAYVISCLGLSKPMAKLVRITAQMVMVLLIALLLTLFFLRWRVSSHIPLANGYETMTFLSLLVATVGLCFSRRHTLALPFGLLISGFALMVATFSSSNPSVTLLQPVLASPLLCIHVAVVMCSYTLLALLMFVGVAALILGRRHPSLSQRLGQVSFLVLYPALFLLAAGIFIGAVWANISWGCYWSWDPKEVWALITLMVYSVPLHSRRLSPHKAPAAWHTFMVVAFLCVLITYFGVNFLLGGMHSYA